MKYLDMPEGNDYCRPLEELEGHVSRGRSVGIVPIKQRNGKDGVYIYSAKAEDTLTRLNIKQHCVRMVLGARSAATSDECTPVPRDL